MSDESTPEERRALFRVVRGEPTAEEVAALAVTLAAAVVAGGGAGTPDAGPLSAWNDRGALLRIQPSPGPGAWRTSTWPR